MLNCNNRRRSGIVKKLRLFYSDCIDLSNFREMREFSPRRRFRAKKSIFFKTVKKSPDRLKCSETVWNAHFAVGWYTKNSIRARRFAEKIQIFQNLNLPPKKLGNRSESHLMQILGQKSEAWSLKMLNLTRVDIKSNHEMWFYWLDRQISRKYISLRFKWYIIITIKIFCNKLTVS